MFIFFQLTEHNDQSSDSLLIRALKISIFDLLDEIRRMFVIYGASYGVSGAKNLSHNAGE